MHLNSISISEIGQLKVLPFSRGGSVFASNIIYKKSSGKMIKKYIIFDKNVVELIEQMKVAN
jgi:hypothetical protein